MADYTVSNTNANLQKAATEVGAAVDAVGSVYPKLLYLQKTLDGKQFEQYVGGIAAGEEAKEQAAIIDTSYKDADKDNKRKHKRARNVQKAVAAA